MNSNGNKPSQDPKNNNNKSQDNGNSKNNNSNDPNQQNKYKKSYDEFEEKVKGTFKNIQESEAFHYAQSNKEQSITYILLALGVILIFLTPFVGGLILGAIAGYHFAQQIFFYLSHLNQIIDGQDQLRYIVLTAVLIGLFIAAPGIFIGAIISAIFTQLILRKNGSEGSNQPENQDRR
ncbi:MAG: hypothetical protein H0W88_08795 [Parachlamydiaceae bacterium]|nr:hypothetical protein [Parachlamydiaceae bacterium]